MNEFTASMADRLIEKAKGHSSVAYWSLALTRHLGLRTSELLHIRKSNVHSESGSSHLASFVTVHSPWSRHGVRMSCEWCNTYASGRALKVNVNVPKKLQAELMNFAASVDCWLFPSGEGHLKRARLSQIFKEVAEAADLKLSERAGLQALRKLYLCEAAKHAKTVSDMAAIARVNASTACMLFKELKKRA